MKKTEMYEVPNFQLSSFSHLALALKNIGGGGGGGAFAPRAQSDYR